MIFKTCDIDILIPELFTPSFPYIPRHEYYKEYSVMITLKWSEKVTNEQVLERIGEILNNILCRKANWIGHIFRRNCLLHDVIEGQMTELKGVRTRRRTKLLDDLRNRRRYWELKEEAEDWNKWKQQFINQT